MALLRLPLKEIAQVAFQTLLRFPFTLLCSFVGTAAAWTLIDVTYNTTYRETLTKTTITAALGLILFFVLEMISERQSHQPQAKWGMRLLGLVLLAAYYFFLPDFMFQKHVIRYLLWMLALHLAASFAAFLNTRIENGFWQFNKSLFLCLLTALLYSGVLYLGLVLAILAFDQLFDVEMDGEVYAKLWIFMAGLFNTWFFLAGVPDPTSLEKVTDYPKGLKLFTQFVLLPLVTLYLLILYGYMAKIILQWEWPRGWVSYLVLGFSTAGIFSLLLIHPIRQADGNRWINIYAKWFYRALFPLLILLLLAIWRRVHDYGITENRYLVLALALWLLVVALYFLFSRQKNIKFIPMTLAAIAFLAAFGPWGAFAISKRSQTQRLEQLLEQNKLLVDGKIQKATGNIAHQTEFEIGSILNYLGQSHQYESVKPWFGASLDSLFESKPKYGNGTPDIQAVMDLLNLNYRYSPESAESRYFSLNAKDDDVQNIQGYDYQVLLREFYRRADDETPETYLIGNEQLQVKVNAEKNEFQIVFRKETLRHSLESILQKKSGTQNLVPAKKLQFMLKGKTFEALVQITRLSADKGEKGNTFKVSDLGGRILIKETSPENN